MDSGQLLLINLGFQTKKGEWGRASGAKIRKTVNSEICGALTWETKNCDTHTVLPYISRIKGNQTMKFGQLI